MLNIAFAHESNLLSARSGAQLIRYPTCESSGFSFGSNAAHNRFGTRRQKDSTRYGLELFEWLDCLLPAEAIDATVRGLADHGFERRYGLRFEDPQIRFRWLDPSRAPGGITDATIPLPQLGAYAPACGHVIVTENKINFLALPQSPDVLAIFGGGYAIDLLRALPWIANQPLHYWGDVDTHGCAILSRLRQYFPHTRSFLMDRDTLEMHRDLWTEELNGARVLRDLPTLDPHEQALFDDLRNDRLGDRVRLEAGEGEVSARTESSFVTASLSVD